jgi:hypothetical protein
MDLDRVLDAAVQSMITGHHAPHCYSAHVVGRGYVNDGSAVFDRADYLRQLESTAQSEVDNMGFAPGYAEPGYTQPAKGVLLANWNNLPRNLDRILEKLGYAIEWSDEWMTCEGCQKIVRSSADSFVWEPAYKIVNDSEVLCTACYADEHPPEDEDEPTDDSQAV